MVSSHGDVTVAGVAAARRTGRCRPQATAAGWTAIQLALQHVRGLTKRERAKKFVTRLYVKRGRHARSGKGTVESSRRVKRQPRGPAIFGTQSRKRRERTPANLSFASRPPRRCSSSSCFLLLWSARWLLPRPRPPRRPPRTRAPPIVRSRTYTRLPQQRLASRCEQWGMTAASCAAKKIPGAGRRDLIASKPTLGCAFNAGHCGGLTRRAHHHSFELCYYFWQVR